MIREPTTFTVRIPPNPNTIDTITSNIVKTSYKNNYHRIISCHISFSTSSFAC